MLKTILFILILSFETHAEVLDCKNLGDAIEVTACEAGMHKNCERAVRGAVAHIYQIRKHKPVSIQKVKELKKNSHFEVSFLQAGTSKTVTVDVVREKKKCRVNKIY